MSSPSDRAARDALDSPTGGMAAKRPPRRATSDVQTLTNVGPSTSKDVVEIKKGTLIGDYSVRGRLDEGGMGTVYLAIHPVIGKKVAIKVLHPHVARQEEAVARFIQEARAVNAIGHPGIVDVFGFGRFVDGRHYITMEYLEGEQLLQYLNTHGPIPAVASCPIVRQIAESLAAAHAKGVVHRDMKPENVFLLPVDGQNWPPSVKILDFGLAKLIEAGLGGKPRTRAGVTVGTPYYMAPEQCRGKPVDRRADIYALGVMMYEMITGRVPFYAPDSVDVLYMHLSQEPEPPSKHKPCPDEIEAVILRCMAKAPDARPDSMETLIEELDAIMEQLSPERETSGMRPEAELVEEADAFFGSTGEHEIRVPSDESPGRTTRPLDKAELKELADRAASDAGQREPTPAPAVPSLPGAVEPAGKAKSGGRVTHSEEAVPRLPSETVPNLEPVVEGEEPKPVRTRIDPSKEKSAGPRARNLEADRATEAAVPLPLGRGRSPVALWGLVIVQAAAIVVLAGLLLAGRSDSSQRPTKIDDAGVAGGKVEVRASEPVDVYLDGQLIGKAVRHILLVRLNTGRDHELRIQGGGGVTKQYSVRPEASRTKTFTFP